MAEVKLRASVHPLDMLRRGEVVGYGSNEMKGKEFERRLDRYLRVWCGASETYHHPTEAGVDIWFLDRDSRIGAVQAKCWLPDAILGRAALTNFTDEAAMPMPKTLPVPRWLRGRKADFTILAYTCRLSRRAHQMIDFHAITTLDYDTLVATAELIGFVWDQAPTTAAERPAPFVPWREQALAIDAGLSPVKLGQIVSATGTGKTVIMAGMIEKVSSAIVFVPSRELIKQVATTFCRQMPGRSILAVSSEKDLGAEHPTETGVESVKAVAGSSKADHVAEFLRDVEHPVIIATYQSVDTVVDGASRAGKPFKFDLAIYDEAHHLAGGAVGEQPGLYKQSMIKIKANRSRWITATPRVVDPRDRVAAEAAGYVVYSHDDVAQFGPVLYQLSVGEAIQRGLLSPFEIVCAVITDAKIKTLYDKLGRSDEFRDMPNDKLDSFHSVATVVEALVAAFDPDNPMSSVLTFHNSIRAAQRAAGLYDEIGKRLGLDVEAVAVSGESTPDERAAARRMLSGDGGAAVAVVTNCRLFGEGTDSPALGMIVLHDTRSSIEGIVQIIGRALRKDRSGRSKKTVARIVLPIFAGDGNDPDTVVAESRWRQVNTIGQAMKHMGVIPKTVARLTNRAKVSADDKGTVVIPVVFPGLPECVRSDDLAEALETYVLGKAWTLQADEVASYSEPQYREYSDRNTAIFNANQGLSDEQLLEKFRVGRSEGKGLRDAQG